MWRPKPLTFEVPFSVARKFESMKDPQRNGSGRTTLLVVIALLVAAGLAWWFSNSGSNSSGGDSSDPVLELAKEETEWLWKVEHRSNVLGAFGFAALKDGLKAADRSAISALLADDFLGEIQSSSDEVLFQSTHLTARRSQKGGDLVEVSGEQFVDHLLQLRSKMDVMSHCSIGVKLISPVDREAPDDNWITLCEMWMRGMADGRRIEVNTLFNLETLPPDKDLMSGPQWIKKWSLLETSISDSASEMFQDVTSASGVETEGLHDNWKSTLKINNPGGIFACDFNRDGRSDFLVTDVNPIGNALYMGLGGGRFENVTNKVGLGQIRQVSLARGNAAFVDLNNDGWIDLLHTEGALWENDGGKRFIDRSSQTNLFRVADYLNAELTSISTADFDRDGLLDLYVSRRNQMPDSWLEGEGEGPGSVLCRNLGDWQFADVTAESGTNGHKSLIFTTVWLDANNDNWPDLSVINEFGDSFLYVNQQNGKFLKQDVDTEKADFGSMGVDAGDIDNDGFIDIYVAGMYSKAGSRIIGNLANDSFPTDVMDRLDSLIDGSELYRNKGNLAFTASGAADRVHNVGWSWGPTLSDFNNDGWLDIYSPAGYMSRDRLKPDG